MNNNPSHNCDSANTNDILCDTALVGYFCPSNKPDEQPTFKVFVNGDNGSIPHLHIWDNDTNGNQFHTCVCLNKVEYFHHTGKENILSAEQKVCLVEFLKDKCNKNKRYKTNWEYALSMWNDNNTDKIQVDETSDILDYTEL